MFLEGDTVTFILRGGQELTVRFEEARLATLYNFSTAGGGHESKTQVMLRCTDPETGRTVWINPVDIAAVLV
jgi:hypothetical protein